MKPKRLAPSLAILGALAWAGAARAQSGWSSNYFWYAPFYCESYLVYDPTYSMISGYSRTFDYENEGYRVGVQAYFYDANNAEYYSEDMGEYEYAEADVYSGGPPGNYWSYGEHWGVGADWGCCEYYLGETATNLYKDPPTVTACNIAAGPWYAGSTNLISVSGTYLGGWDATFSGCPGDVSVASWSSGYSNITEYVSVLPNLSQSCTLGISLLACAAQVLLIPPPPTVSVTSASIPNDNITVVLQPAGTSGTLTVQLTGGGSYTVFQGTQSGGTHNFSFGIPNLPDGQEFTQIVATWAAAGQTPSASYNYHIKVLGNYNNTMYNTPTESYCSGAGVDMSYVTGNCSVVQNCNFTAFQGKSDWSGQVMENGSGLSQTSGIGVVSREWYCSGPSNPVRRVGAPCPSCANATLSPGSSVARNANNSDLPCGATLYVNQVGTVTVADSGGGLASNQLDHYAGYGGCSRGAGTIGVRKVIRLF